MQRAPSGALAADAQRRRISATGAEMRIRTTAMVLVLLAAWVLAVTFSITLGGAIHLLPAFALLVLASQLIARRRNATSTSHARWLASKGADR